MLKRFVNKLSVIIGVVFLIGIYKYVIQTGEIRLVPYINKIGVLSIGLGMICYFISHFFRALRIALVMGREDVSLKDIISTHLYSNGINLVLPFKLGDVYRLYEFHHLVKKYEVSVSAITTEKIVDFFFLFTGLIISFCITDTRLLDLNVTFILFSVSMAIILLTCFLLPENIEGFNLFIAKRYSALWVIKVLMFTSKICLILENIKVIFREKILILLVFTFLVWFFEIMSFICLFSWVLDVNTVLLLAFLTYLSVCIPSGIMGLGGVQLGFYFIFLIRRDFPFMIYSLIYQLSLFLPAILLSMFILLSRKYRKYIKEDNNQWKMKVYHYITTHIAKGTLLKDLKASVHSGMSGLYKYVKMKADL